MHFEFVEVSRGGSAAPATIFYNLLMWTSYTQTPVTISKMANYIYLPMHGMMKGIELRHYVRSKNMK